MSDPRPRSKGRRCPSCKGLMDAPGDPRHLPFCSARCKMVDLGRWLGGEYAVPSNEPVDEEAWAEAMRGQEEQ